MCRPVPWQQAVVDRIVDGDHAVLLVGEEEREAVVDAGQLPEAAVEGSWLNVRFAGDALLEAQVDDEETESRRREIAAKLERLRRRGRRTPGNEGDAR